MRTLEGIRLRMDRLPHQSVLIRHEDFVSAVGVGGIGQSELMSGSSKSSMLAIEQGSTPSGQMPSVVFQGLS